MALIRCVECNAKVSDKANACTKCGAPIEISKNKLNSQIRSVCGCFIILLLVAGIIAAFVGCDQGSSRSKTSDAPASQPAPEASKEPSATMLTYEVIDRNKYDAPVKTQIELNAIVSGTITEPGLRQLLQKLYDEARATRGFKYYDGRPTHVFIYLYTSREHFKSGMGQWIAMLSKVGENSRTDTRVKTELISHLTAKPEVKHGLPESKRKEIFRAIVNAEDRADKDAQRMYPLSDPLKPGYSQAKASTQVKKQAEALNSLTKKYKDEVAKRYGITYEQLREISVEGIVKNWPIP